MLYRRLPLEGAQNVRDLGGYPVQGGGVTRFGTFIRSESTFRFAPGDLDFLKTYGVTVSIDFRGDNEVERNPSSLTDLPWVKYIRFPTYDKQLAFASRAERDNSRPPMDAFLDWGEKYIELVETARHWVRDTLRTMASAEGAVIYNCTTGKDRAGVISALLLSLAGVSAPDVIADYCVSELYLAEVYKELLAEYLARWPNEEGNLDSPFFKTSPKNMEALLRHINDKYGGVERYAIDCGVSPQEIGALRVKLVEK